MSRSGIELRGITWSHTRGYTPMAATAQRFEELNPGIRITWEKRSLQAFADEPIDQLAARYDLLVIDHPWAGFAAHTGVIAPLDDYLPAKFLEDQEKNTVGHSYESYSYNGQQWALAIDAATPVASARPDLLQAMGMSMPATWGELLHLAKMGRVAVPGIPQDTLMNFYMLCSTLGEDPCKNDGRIVSEAIGIQALTMLRELSAHLNKECFNWNPIQVYEAMTRGDEFVYCPFAYGYSNYAKPFYARKLLKFADLVSLPGTGRCRSTLGGTGLAISAKSEHKDIAALYAQYVASPESQGTFFVEFGGQPGHRKAWMNAYANSVTGNYYKDTLPALERAFLRPRYYGHMSFQDSAGAPIREYMMNGGNEKILLGKLNELYLVSKEETQAA